MVLAECVCALRHSAPTSNRLPEVSLNNDVPVLLFVRKRLRSPEMSHNPSVHPFFLPTWEFFPR